MKTIIKIFFIIWILVPGWSNADAQNPVTWQKVFGLDSNVQGTYGIQTSDGGYAILARWSPSSIYRGWIRVLKLDKHGNLIWTKNYLVQTYNAMIEDSDSGYVLIGGGGAGNGAALFKINSIGDSILYKTYGGPSIIEFRKFKKYYDGGFIVTGRSSNDFGYIERLDSNYNTIWTNSYSSINYENILTSDIAFDKNNNIAISLYGYISQISDGGLLKLTPDGNQYKIVFHNTPLVSDNYNEIIQINEKYAVSGGAYNYYDSVSSIYCLLDTSGNLILRKYYYHHSPYHSQFPYMTYASGNYLVLGGYSDEIRADNRKMALRKIDYFGDIVWERVINNALSFSAPSTVKWTSDNGYLLTGVYENIPADTYCIYIIKTDSNAYTEPVGISDEEFMIPEGFVLYQNYPNPFNPDTKIKYEIRKKAHYKMKLYDVNGRVISILIDEIVTPGTYEKILNNYFKNLSSSVYFISLENDEKVLTRKLLFIK